MTEPIVRPGGLELQRGYKDQAWRYSQIQVAKQRHQDQDSWRSCSIEILRRTQIRTEGTQK
jgi:hypothetical protein